MVAPIIALGFFIEWIEISCIFVALFLSLMNNLGTDFVWAASPIAVVQQTSFLTPPFGWATNSTCAVSLMPKL